MIKATQLQHLPCLAGVLAVQLDHYNDNLQVFWPSFALEFSSERSLTCAIGRLVGALYGVPELLHTQAGKQ